MLLPLQRVRRARAIAMRDLPLDMGPADHWRCPGARELLRWVLAMQAALQLRSLCKQVTGQYTPSYLANPKTNQNQWLTTRPIHTHSHTHTHTHARAHTPSHAHPADRH